VILITLAAYLINNSKEFGFEGAAQAFKTFFKSLSLTLPSVVLATSLVRPDLAFFPVPGWTLGGYMIHPNKLSIVCALGICVWMAEHRSPFRLLISLGLFTVALMTGSRSGSLLSAFALLHGLGSMVPRRLVAPLYILMAACLFATLLLVFGYANFMQGNELTNLNGRDAVWRATRYMVSQKPILGWGWIEGPGQLGFYTGEDWWFSHNAQNDILNFAVSSGIAAGLISAYFYLRTLVVTARYEFNQDYRMLFSASIVIFFSSMVEPISSNLANMVGFALIFLVLISFKKRGMEPRVKVTRGRAPSRLDRQFTPNYIRLVD
jgi:O-antigen ligase